MKEKISDGYDSPRIRRHGRESYHWPQIRHDPFSTISRMDSNSSRRCTTPIRLSVVSNSSGRPYAFSSSPHRRGRQHLQSRAWSIDGRRANERSMPPTTKIGRPKRQCPALPKRRVVATAGGGSGRKELATVLRPPSSISLTRPIRTVALNSTGRKSFTTLLSGTAGQ